jgi:hypothetical protein
MSTMLYIQFDNRVVADRLFFAVHLRYSEDNMYKPAIKEASPRPPVCPTRN